MNCFDWNDASQRIGFFRFAAMRAKTDNLPAVGPLAQGAQGASHMLGCLLRAYQYIAARGRFAVLWRIHWHKRHYWQPVVRQRIGLSQIVSR
jgi:hypothetical protein